MSQAIGYVVNGRHFLCEDCLRLEPVVECFAVYLEGLGQHGQGCHNCHKILVESDGPGCTELYPVGCLDCFHPISYLELPESLREAVRLYVEHGVSPGAFLTAVICNDLNDTVMCASAENLIALPKILSWFWYEAPPNCWGGRNVMKAWIRGLKAG